MGFAIPDEFEPPIDGIIPDHLVKYSN